MTFMSGRVHFGSWGIPHSITKDMEPRGFRGSSSREPRLLVWDWEGDFSDTRDCGEYREILSFQRQKATKTGGPREGTCCRLSWHRGCCFLAVTGVPCIVMT